MNIKFKLIKILSAYRFLRLVGILKFIFITFGVLWTFVELTSFFFQWIETNVKPFGLVFLLLGVLIGFVISWVRAIPNTSVKFKIKGRDVSVVIIVDDIFNLKGSIVVPTNDTFDTSMEDDIISSNSIQGIFTNKYCIVAQLDEELARELTNHEYKEIPRQQKRYGKIRRYQIGTVAAIRYTQRKAYFVATATLNEDKRASSSFQNIQDSLPQLWEFARTKGYIDSICIPLLGTGYGRIREPKSIIIQEIIKSFVAACHSGKFCNELLITIYPNDFYKGSIDLLELGRYLEHICKYDALSTSSPNGNVGTPVDDE